MARAEPAGEGVDRRRLGQVDQAHLGPARPGAAGRRRFAPGPVTAGQDHGGPGRRQGLGRGQPQAVGRPGDHRHRRPVEALPPPGGRPGVCAHAGRATWQASAGGSADRDVRARQLVELDLVAPHAQHEQDGVEVGDVDGGVGRLAHHRPGVEGDAEARRAEHVEVVGPVAHRHHLVERDPLLGRQLPHELGLGRPVDHRPQGAPGEAAVDHLQRVGVGVVDAQLGRQMVGDRREPARHDGGAVAEAAQGADEGAGPGGEADPAVEPVEHGGVEALQGGHPGGQRLGEVELAGHGPLGDGRHLIAGAGLVGQQLDGLVLDEGGVDVEHHQPVGPAAQPLVVDGHVARQVVGPGQQGGLDAGPVGPADRQLVGHHRVTGQADDPVDVAAVGGHHGGDGAELGR